MARKYAWALLTASLLKPGMRIEGSQRATVPIQSVVSGSKAVQVTFTNGVTRKISNDVHLMVKTA